MAPNTTQHVVPSSNDARLVGAVLDWSKRMWNAVQVTEDYEPSHKTLFDEFDHLRDQAKSSGDPLLQDHRSLLRHVAAIYNHTASQGYQPTIHLAPLRQAVHNWCLERPVEHWKAPPDQQSRSPSPAMPPPTPAVPPPAVPPSAPRGLKVPAMVPQGNFKPTSKPAPTTTDKGKGKPTGKVSRAKQPPTSAELVNDEDETETKTRKSLPTTWGMEKHLEKCERCVHGSHGCHVHSNATACFECHWWKVKCSRVKVNKTEADPSASLGEDPDATPAPKKRTAANRKKPTAVPAGEAGEYGEFRSIIFIFIVQSPFQHLKPPPTSPIDSRSTRRGAAPIGNAWRSWRRRSLGWRPRTVLCEIGQPTDSCR